MFPRLLKPIFALFSVMMLLLPMQGLAARDSAAGSRFRGGEG